MPSPITTRRDFLNKGLALLAATTTVPMFLQRTAMAMSLSADMPRSQQTSGKDGKILVVVQLGGGNDGLSMVVPYADDAYHRARTTIGHDAKTVLKIDDYIGLNPNMGPLKALYDQGHMAIVQGVGYPNPNRSHFRAMDIWQSAQPLNASPTNGWLGRYFDNTCPGCDPHVGVAIGQNLPLAMQGDRVMPLALQRPENYRYAGNDVEHFDELNHALQSAQMPTTMPARQNPMKVPAVTAASQLDFLQRTALDAQMSSDQILRVTRHSTSTTTYPGDEFSNSLRTIASMIAGGLSTRVYYLSLGGFDTHAGQRNRHDTLMKTLSAGLAAFWSDLQKQHNDDRVLVMTFSEFGRRVQQNASGGTDHGAAAPMLLLGPKIQPGVIGRHPSLTDLDHGDLKFAIDFRSVYASVLQNWLNTPSKPILGQQFPVFNAVRA